MSFLVLPAGQTLRAVAHRLGVPVEELQRHTGVADSDAPLPSARRVQVPDGFLQSRATARQLKDAVVAQSGRKGGMNTFLALDIEQKRTRAAGGMRAHGAAEFELEALAEAWRTYCRFEADSNELAIEMFDKITVTQSIEVRGQAFSGLGCAFAQRLRLFGDPPERSRPQALSAAKAALLATPKLGDAHLAMALALGAVEDAAALEEARAELETAIQQDPKAGRCWAEMAAIIERQGIFSEAEAAVEVALELEPTWLFSLQTAASLALRRGDTERGIELLDSAIQAAPYHANVLTNLALFLKTSGQMKRAEEIQNKSMSLTTSEAHTLLVNGLFESGRFPA